MNATSAALNDIGALIEVDPEIRGGRPCIAGTGVSVHRVASWYKLGLTPEEIADNFGHLSLAQVHAALAYYHANQAEIEVDLAADERESERLQSAAEQPASAASTRSSSPKEELMPASSSRSRASGRSDRASEGC